MLDLVLSGRSVFFTGCAGALMQQSALLKRHVTSSSTEQSMEQEQETNAACSKGTASTFWPVPCKATEVLQGSQKCAKGACHEA